jgi:hypothetical protein
VSVVSDNSDEDPGDLDAAEQQLHQAIAEVLGRNGLMTTKWILAVEGLGSDGSRAMEAFTSPDFRAWDSLGLLGYLDARERGAVGQAAAREFLDGDEPEGC